MFTLNKRLKDKFQNEFAETDPFFIFLLKTIDLNLKEGSIKKCKFSQIPSDFNLKQE